MLYSLKPQLPPTLEEYPLTLLQGPAAQVLNFGGTSFRFSFVLQDGSVHEYCEGSWEGYFEEISRGHILETVPLGALHDHSITDPGLESLRPTCALFAEVAAYILFSAARQYGLDPDTIKRIGITTPGVIDKERKVIAKANNIQLQDIDGFDMAGAIRDSLVWYSDEWDKPLDVTIYNDAEAAALGEFAHSEGALISTHGNGVAVNGTAFGGQLLIRGVPSDLYREFGYTLLRLEQASTDDAPLYRFQSLEDTFQYYDREGADRLRRQIPGMKFLETIAGGKWAAVSFLKQAVEADLANALTEIDPDLNREDLKRIYELPPENDLCWDTKQFEGTINRLGELRVGLGRHTIRGGGELQGLARRHDMQLAAEIGAALHALQAAVTGDISTGLSSQDIRIVLASTVFEGHRDDKEWLERIRAVSGLSGLRVSRLTQTVREAAPHSMGLDELK